jgi:DNA-directed RNA polymerase subunit omega
MLDDFRNEELVKKVGGRFKLTTLIQKRMVALNRGARPLIDLATKNQMEIVVAEILNDKIYLDTAGNVQAAEADAVEAVDDGGPSLADIAPE